MKGPALWILLLVACLLLGSSAFAKKGDDDGTTVVGYVMAPVNVKPDSGLPPVAPVEACAVSLQQDGQIKYQAMSGPTGQFIIDKVKAGDYTLVAERPHLGQATQACHVGGQMEKVSVTLTLEARWTRTVKGDQVCVAYSAPPPEGVLPPTTGQVIPGPPNDVNEKKASIIAGADPHKKTKKDNANIEAYYTAVSLAANAVMVFDPDDPHHAAYAEINVRPFWLCLNADASKVYVSTDQQAVNVYSTGQRRLLKTISAGGIVTDVVLSPDGNWVLASVIAGTPGILVIDPRTDAPVRFVNTPPLSSGERGLPMAVASTVDNSKFYVVMGTTHSGEVVAIDSQSMRVLGRGKVGPQPLDLGLSPDGRLLFVANGANATVSVVDSKTMTQIGVVSVGDPTRVAVRPDGSKVYVTCKASESVYVITNASGTARKIKVGKQPMGIAISSNGRRVYVANHDSNDVTIIDGEKDVPENTTTGNPNSQPYGIAVSR